MMVLAIRVLLILSIAVSQTVVAQQQRGPWFVRIQGGALQQFETSLDNGSGDFSVFRWFIQPSVGYAWDRYTSVSLAVGLGESTYHFSTDATIDDGLPWDRIRDYRLSVPVRFRVGKASAIVIPSLRSYAEAGADLNDGRTEGVIAGVSWQLGKRLRLGPGFGWFSDLGGGSNAFPIVVIDWQITDRLKLGTGRGIGASQGPGLTFGWQMTQKWTLDLAGRYERVRFALDDSGPAPSGIGQDQSFQLVLAAAYSPWPFTSVSVFTGVELNGNLRLEDADAELIDRSDYRPAPLLGFVFSSMF